MLTDTHFGCHNASPFYHNNMKKFLDQILFPYIDKHDIKHVVHLGDLVDSRKSISYYTTSRMRIDYFQSMMERDLNYYQIVGNHDSYYKHKLEIHSAKELYHDYDIEIIDYPQEVLIEGFKVLFVPWMCKDNYDRTVELLNTSDAKVVMGHLELAGFQMYKGGILSHGYNESLFDRFDSVFSGHFHHSSVSNHVSFIGAAGEYTWSDSEDPRGFTVYDTETSEVTFVQNPFKIFHKILWTDDYLEETGLTANHFKNCIIKIYPTGVKDYAKLDKFVESLQKVGVEDCKVIAEQEEIVGEDVDETTCEDTPSSFKTHVYGMSGDFDKERMADILISAYQEALACAN